MGDDVTALGGPSPESVSHAVIIETGQPGIPDRDQFGDSDAGLYENMRHIGGAGTTPFGGSIWILKEAMPDGYWHYPAPSRFSHFREEDPRDPLHLNEIPG